jgi:hypothetical protein
MVAAHHLSLTRLSIGDWRLPIVFGSPIADLDCGVAIGLPIGDWIEDWRLDCGLAIHIVEWPLNRQSAMQIASGQ